MTVEREALFFLRFFFDSAYVYITVILWPYGLYYQLSIDTNTKPETLQLVLWERVMTRMTQFFLRGHLQTILP